MVKTLKQSLLIFILSNLLILWLYLFNNFFVVDVLIVTSNIFSFVLNNIYICLLFKTINYYNSIKNFIIVRIGNKKFDEIVISRLFRTNLLTIILGYIVPIFLYFNKFYSYYRYITFIIVQYFLFTLYMAITFLYVKIICYKNVSYFQPIFLIPAKTDYIIGCKSDTNIDEKDR